MKSLQQKIEFISYSSIKILSAILVLSGIGLLISSVSLSPWSKQMANTLATTDTSISTSTSTSVDSSGTGSGTTSTTSTISTESSIKFTSTVPDKVSTNFDVTVESIGINGLTLSVRGLDSTTLIFPRAISTYSTGVIYSIPVNELSVGKYELIAFGYQLDGTKKYVNGPNFEVISTTLNQTTTTNVSGTNTNQTTTPTTTTTTTTTTETNTQTDTVHDETQNVVSEPEIKELTTEPVYVPPSINLILPIQTSYSNFVPVQVSVSVEVKDVSLYARSALNTQRQFIGKARYYDSGQWLLMIDTNQIPNGEYRLIAVANLNDVEIVSDPQRFVIYNSKISTTDSSIKNTTISSDVDETETEDVVELETIKTVNITPPQTPEPVILSDGLKELVSRILKESEKPINARLREYAETVKAAAKIIPEDAVDAERDIMAILLEDSRLDSISLEAKQRLKREVVRMVKNSARVELLLARKNAIKQKYEDFIKDLSETMVVPEDSLVDINSPREFGLVREDLLKIESVSPIVSVDTVSTSTTIYTEIRGQALPNSLVTLYIYSSPVMVTVQTDADGTFVYVYEKDLSDGNHEVFVALTTSAGAVVAKSEAFQFVREAQAFNTPDTENGDILEPATETTQLTSNPYFIVFSFSILVFGLILLFLGFNSGKRSENIIATE